MALAWDGEGYWRQERRPSWLLVLGASALLHLPLLVLLGKALAVRSWSASDSTLQVTFLPSAPARSETAPVADVEEGGQANSTMHMPRTSQPTDSGNPTATPSADFDSQRAVDAALDMARAIGRGTADLQRRALPVPAANLTIPAPTTAKPSPLDSPPPGETRYADGRMKVVDRWGRVSCIKEPADFVYGLHGEVIPRLAVNTNCP
jgi:hypothetical protein